MRIVNPPKDAQCDCLPGHPSGIRKNEDGTTKAIFESKAQVRRRQKKERLGSSLGSEEFHQKKPQDCRYIEYDMSDFWVACVDRYPELAPTGTKLKKVNAPFIDEALRCPSDFGAPEDAERAATLLRKQIEEGGENELGAIASRVLMKCLYGARCCRFDLLRPICALAQKVTKWDRECDAKLHRLMCYINASKDVKMYGKVGDSLEDVRLALFSDTDFAGCKSTMRSTPGVFLKLSGPNTHFPLSGCSVKQGAVSHSTTEAEIVAADLAMR